MCKDKRTKDQEHLICLAINTCGTGEHPFAEPDVLRFFRQGYVFDCIGKILRKGHLKEAGTALLSDARRELTTFGIY